MADFRGYVTAAGQQFESLAKQMKYPVTIGVIEIGDGKLPDSESPITRTRLINPLKQFPAIVEQDDKNPGEWVATCYIPADDAINGAGYMIREIGCKLINQGNGILYAYRRVSDDWKPADSSGEAKSFIYKLRFIPSNGVLLTPTIDPSVVLVSKEELARVMKAHEKSRDHPDASEKEKGLTRYASQQEVNDGTLDNVAITPKRMRFGVSFSKAGNNGYIALPSWLGGYVFQFGKKEVVANSAPVTFPIAFPTAVGVVIPIKQSASAGIFITPDNIGLAGFTAYGWSSVNTQSSVNTFWWFAIGY